MGKRFFSTVGLAVAWSTVAFTGVGLDWVLLGAAIIGLCGSIGIEPPSIRLREASTACA